MAVIGEAHDPVLGHVPHFRQFLAFFPFGDGPDHFHMDVPFFLGPFLDAADHNGAVDHRFGIGHAGHPGDAPVGCCHGAGDQIFLGFQPRFPEMGVEVDEAGSHHKARCIKYFIRRCIDVRRRLGDFPVFHQKVHHLVQLLAGIYDPSVLN